MNEDETGGECRVWGGGCVQDLVMKYEGERPL